MFVFVAASLLAGGQGENGDSPAGGAEGSRADIDYLGVAAVMIRDGNIERAARALEEVDPSEEGVDRRRYYTLSGLLELRRNNNAQAISNFQRAIELGQEDPVLNVYLAQAHYAEGQYQQAIDSIDNVPNLAQFPALYGLLAESFWQMGEQARAYDTLQRATELFPSQARFLRQQVFYLVDLGLTQAAVDLSMQYLDRLEQDAAAYVTVGEALRRGGNAELAIQTLEMGRMQHQADRQIHLALAQAYLDAGRPRAAGSMIERIAAVDPSLYYEAAEIYRRAGEFDRALFLNSLVLQEERKALQRFHILLSMERYESAAALEQRLLRTGSLADDANRYALAYAMFETRQFESAISYLNQIESADYFRRATQLRQAIETVRESERLTQTEAGTT